MVSPRSGDPVANQFRIRTNEGEFFQSYNRIIAFRSNDGLITLDDVYWKWSVTTSKYRRQFLHEGIDETREKIKSGEYKLANLN